MWQDIQNIRISKQDRLDKFTDETMEDAMIMYRAIIRLVGREFRNISEVQVDFDVTTFYTRPADIEQLTPVSDDMEAAFTKVVDLYAKHQDNWNEEEAKVFLREMTEDEMDELQDNEDDSEDELF